jgi:hypothetical protein
MATLIIFGALWLCGKILFAPVRMLRHKPRRRKRGRSRYRYVATVQATPAKAERIQPTKLQPTHDREVQALTAQLHAMRQELFTINSYLRGNVSERQENQYLKRKVQLYKDMASIAAKLDKYSA